MTATVKQVVDAIAADVESLVLERHSTWKYWEPVALRMDQGSWLAVWPEENNPVLLVTNSQYQDNMMMHVAWIVPSFEMADGHVNPELASQAMDSFDAVVTRLKTYGEQIPGITPAVFGIVTRVEYGAWTNASYKCDITLNVEGY